MLYIADPLDGKLGDEQFKNFLEIGALYVPNVLTSGVISELVKNLSGRTDWQPRERVVNGVSQDMDSIDVEVGPAFQEVAWQIQAMVFRWFDRRPEPTLDYLHFNEVNLQRYRAGSTGISAHCDRSVYKKLIAVLTLSGKATFQILAEDRETLLWQQEVKAGGLIIMRAPDFGGKNVSPVHRVVPEGAWDRHTLNLRQKEGAN